MRNLYKLSEFKEINSIVKEEIVTKTEDDGASICGLCLYDATNKELFVAYGGSCEKLERIVSDRIDDLMVLRHDNQWRLCIRAHSTTRCYQNSNTVCTPSFFEGIGGTTIPHQTYNEEKGIGIISWYAEENGKRYGVVTCIKEKKEDDFDVFLHHTEWCDVLPVYNGNNILVFDIIQEKKRRKAVRCRYLTVDDDWSELLKVLPRTCVEIQNGRRHGKRRINMVESLLSTINLNSSRVNKELFEKKIIGAAIEFSDSQKKECLINGTLPQKYFSSDFKKITEMLSDNDLAVAIKKSDEEGCFVEIAEKRIKKFSFNHEDSISAINDIILAFKSMDIKQYLYGTLLSQFPTNLTNENLQIISTAALYIWKHRNKELPMSLLDNYPSVRLAIWYGGGNIPIDRKYLCGFVEEKTWFVDYLSNKSGREINLHPLFSIAKKRLIELSTFNNDSGFQKINKWYSILKDRGKIQIIKDSENPIAGIFLWLDGVVSKIDMKYASNNFIYLNANDQVRYIKRLTQKKAMGNEDITIDTFSGLVYADLELHRDVEVFNPNRSLDISTHVLVQLIEKFVKTGIFMLESELFQVVFTGITKYNKSFKLDHYFDKCHGRCQDANCSREKCHGRCQDANCSREISKRTYYWFPRDFCDAQKANKKDENDKEYYWCGNARCYKSSVELHKPEQWLNYSLWDIIHIFDLNTNHDESSLYKSYITFISQVNKFNQIAERLICKECGELLYPQIPNGLSNFHYYSVTQFRCINRECFKYNKIIYLNHCFHPECNGVIDSRESQQCDNGRYICPSCAHCCTDHEFYKAIQYKKNSGGYLSPSLIDCLHNHKGHNDKGIFFCYKCGSRLKEDRHDGESLYSYKNRYGYKKMSMGYFPCKNGYQMPVIIFDDNDFIALGKDIKDKSPYEIKDIISELRVVNSSPYKTIVHSSSLTNEVIYYCDCCEEVRYKAKPYKLNRHFIESPCKHLVYTLNRIVDNAFIQ